MRRIGKQTPAVDPESRLLRLIAAAEPKHRTALLQAVTAAKAAQSLDVLSDLLLQGRFEEALDAAVRIGVIRLTDEATAVYVAAGVDTSALLSDVLGVTVGFDQVNTRAVRIMQAERLRLIREFTAGQRLATREALSDGIRRGVNPREQARLFRSSIGLTARQQQAVNNFRQLLETGSSEALQRQLRDRRFDSTIRRAVASGEPLSATQVERMTQRYSERYLKFRAETIARTEALRAVHQGSEEGYRQAVDEGLIAPEDLTRTWRTARDERVRGSHASMEGQQRQLDDEPFVSGVGNPIKFPGDPEAVSRETVQCRCALATRIDETA